MASKGYGVGFVPARTSACGRAAQHVHHGAVGKPHRGCKAKHCRWVSAGRGDA